MMRRVAPTLTRQSGGVLVAAMRLGSTKSKAATVDDAVYLIPDGCTVTVGGFVAQSAPEYVLEALGRRFKETGSPKNLTLLFGGGPGDFATRGLNHLAHPGMLKRTVGAHYGQVPMLAQLALENKIEAYCLPMGSTSRMIRAAASRQPGHITEVGFGTLVDPAFGGGKLNAKTTENLVEQIEVLGKKYLIYKAIPIDVAIVRGTTGDEDGNITMEHESLLCDHMNQAMAARSRRGLVICEVKDFVAARTLRARDVRIPGTLVDCVVPSPAEYHKMSFFKVSDRSWTGQISVNTMSKPQPFPLSERKVIARRAAMELLSSQVVCIGLGMPEGVALVANEERILPFLELTTEAGVHGGVGATGRNFGPAVDPEAFLSINQQFDFYSGGGLDICFLGNAETDESGNVNITRVGKKLNGPGGFIEVSQSTKRVNLLGTFTAGGLEIAVKDGKLQIVKEGSVKKFVKKVKEVTFAGPVAAEKGQIVNFITERCVFSLTREGLELVEIAPGVDLQRDILDQMEFAPIIRKPLPRLMDSAIFRNELMGLLQKSFTFSMTDRVHYASDANEIYLNLSNCHVATKEITAEIEKAMRDRVESIRQAAGDPTKRVHFVGCYDNFTIEGSIADHFKAMAQQLEKELYLSRRRYTLRAFSGRKLQTTLDVKQGISENGLVSIEAAVMHCRASGAMLSPSEVENAVNKAYGADASSKGITLKQLEELVSSSKKQR